MILIGITSTAMRKPKFVLKSLPGGFLSLQLLAKVKKLLSWAFEPFKRVSTFIPWSTIVIRFDY